MHFLTAALIARHGLNSADLHKELTEMEARIHKNLLALVSTAATFRERMATTLLIMQARKQSDAAATLTRPVADLQLAFPCAGHLHVIALCIPRGYPSEASDDARSELGSFEGTAGRAFSRHTHFACVLFPAAIKQHACIPRPD